MATQQQNKKPAPAKPAASKAKQTASAKQELNPAEQLQDVEERRTRLKALILLGKERGYLTFAEINDHLPEMLEVEQIEGVVSMINDMGITVHDQAPDVENQVMSDAPPVAADEDAVEAAEAALSTVDSDFGRTTDPVRMYMREMGTVGLLTRQDEIVIAKRIEEGLKHMIQAISACPATIAEILALADKVTKEELRIDEVIDGFIDVQDEMVAEPVVEEELDEEEVEDEEESEEDGDAAAAANLAQLKEDALARFAVIADLFSKAGQVVRKIWLSQQTIRQNSVTDFR
jgi:RNA polymerase primary sigma factor